MGFGYNQVPCSSRKELEVGTTEVLIALQTVVQAPIRLNKIRKIKNFPSQMLSAVMKKVSNTAFDDDNTYI
jgi:hypothetical protein